MNRVLEIGAYVIAGAVALGGGFVGADVLFGDTAETSAAVDRASEAPANSALARDEHYRFSFRYPEDWILTQPNSANIAAAAVRRDGTVCLVSVQPQEIPSDASGKPANLSGMLGDVTPAQLEAVALAGMKAKFETFEKATLGGQEARKFVIKGILNPYGMVKIYGHATLRSYGAVVLMCVARIMMHDSRDVQAAIRMTHDTFRFE